MNRLKILLSIAAVGMLLLSACQDGQVPNVTIPNGNASVQVLSDQQLSAGESASRAGIADSSIGNSLNDDGTADQGSGDVLVVPTVVAINSASDDGTADQGPGDVPTSATETAPGNSPDDDGTPDQGPGDAPATGNSVGAANAGNEIEFTGLITSIGDGFVVIDGETVFIGNGAEVKGSLTPDATVKVHVTADADGLLVAREVEVLVTADGTVVDDSGHHGGNDDGPSHDTNDDHGGQSNSGSDNGSALSGNSGPSDNSGQSGSDNSGHSSSHSGDDSDSHDENSGSGENDDNSSHGGG